MKPLRIKMQAFGPYAQVEEVDFSRVSKSPIFLIHGPTGAGKTAIFDAMCFALYGKSSGDLRRPEELRSQLANEDLQTEVEFDFEIGKKLFRVRRLPTQARPARVKSKTGYTDQQHKAVLYSLVRAKSGEFVEAEILAERPQQVADEVENILGFRVEQFRKVVLIPQGNFRDLLIAGSAERERILKILFGTHYYTTIEERLGKMEADLKHQHALETRDRDGLLKKNGASDLEDLKATLIEEEEELESLRKAKGQFKVKFDEANQRFAVGEKLDFLFIDFEMAQQEAQHLARQKSEVEKNRIKIGNAEKAARLADPEQALVDATSVVEEAKESLIESKETIKDIIKDVQATKKVLSVAVAKKSQVPNKNKELAKCREQLPRVESLKEFFEQLKKSKACCEAADSSKKEAERSKHIAEGKLVIFRRELEQKSKVASKKDEFKIKFDQANKRLSDLLRLKSFDDALVTARSSYKASETQFEQMSKRFERLQVGLKKKEARWIESSAYRLAQNLRKGDPCIVCGSEEHPSPASSIRRGSLVTDEELVKTREVCEELERIVKDLQGEMNRNKARVAAAEARRDECKKSMLGVEKTYAVIRKEKNNFDSSLKVAQNAEKELKGVGQKIERLEKEIKGDSKHIDNLNSVLRDVLSQTAGIESAITQNKKGIAPRFLDLKNLNREIKRLEVEIKTIEMACEAAEIAFRNAENLRRDCFSEVKNLDGNLKKAIQTKEKAETQFFARLKKEGFKSVGDFSRSSLTKAQKVVLEISVVAFDKEVAGSDKRFGGAQSKIKGLKRPDLELLKRIRKEADGARAKSEREFGRQQKHAETLAGDMRKVISLSKSVAALVKRYETVGRLSQVARGQNHKKLSFQRFVLSALLDDVTIAASERLRKMSSGQYTIRRDQNRRAGAAPSGLGLLVYDDHSGETRAVETLSGGEMFMASLSLALGLADTVQAYEGGIHLDSIFIDEGFGSLDSEKLDLAIDTFVHLNKGGRMVGVISHVTELKERIPVRIEVVPGKKGSRVRYSDH